MCKVSVGEIIKTDPHMAEAERCGVSGHKMSLKSNIYWGLKMQGLMDHVMEFSL